MIKWRWSLFEELSVDELLSIMQLRQQAFIVEQDCVYQGADDLDAVS